MPPAPALTHRALLLNAVTVSAVGHTGQCGIQQPPVSCRSVLTVCPMLRPQRSKSRSVQKAVPSQTPATSLWGPRPPVLLTTSDHPVTNPSDPGTTQGPVTH